MVAPRALVVNQEQWHRVKSIVADAMEVSGTQRRDLIQTSCGGDSAIRAEVESLLLAADAAESLPQARAAIASATEAIAREGDTALRSALERALGHQYEILRPLGRGGMGCVYLARERSLERFVAIKVLRPDLAGTQGHRERFRREARIAASLSHPAILGLHSFGEVENLWYFVMTYVRGETLAQKIEREGMMPWPEGLRIFEQMADALDCAHRNGVVHRDIKPANILIDNESGQAILADFGISKMSGAGESLTATGALIGTPDYMSPEQVTGAPDVDERSDIYSLGAVAYLMFTGRAPFLNDSIGASMYRRLVEDPPAPCSVAANVPADLSAVVERCMARDRTNRWQTARSLKTALGSVVAVDRLPETVRDLPSFGPYAVLWATGWAAFALLTERSLSERTLLLLVALIVPFGLALHLWNGPARGMRFSELLRVALWPPEWWGMWWPRALRRPSDVWDRLPRIAQSVRILLLALCPALVLLILLRRRTGSFDSWVAIGEWGIFVGGSIAVALAFIWARRRGLSTEQSARLLLGPTIASSTWDEPAILRLLAPASGKVRPPDGDAPSDYLRAIREMLPFLGKTDGSAADQTARAADQALRAIDELDRELASISRDAGPDEAARLASQLDVLEQSASGHADDRAELRDLVRHQLELVRRLQARREILQSDRGHLLDLLKTLWTLVRAEADTSSRDSISLERLVAMCDEIRHELNPAAVA
ncbi:MAG: serine/threonine-protein kinase [Gemmatimonadales bacterium]